MTSFSAGDVIAGYRLDEQVGRGGMGLVFRATHVALERSGAVKLIAPELAASQEFRQRFQRESRLAASIDHPHVIPVFDAGEDRGQLYVAMRYVEGIDLGGLLARERTLEPGQAVEIVAQVADALDAAHERGLVHRDVKPANVLLESRGSGYHAYLTDFGLVKAVGAATGVLTRTGQWLGTPDYAAPEQILGSEVDARTDVYSLGCMLYQAISGKPPFERDSDVAKMYAHLSEPAPALSAARPDVPAGLDGVIRTALAKKPEERYASAGELASAARAALSEPAITPATRPMQPRAPAEAPHPRPPARRPRWLLPVAGVALVVAVAAVVVVAGGGGGDGGGSGDGGGGGGGGSSAAVIPPGNLTTNPSFEQDTSGWDVSDSRLTREEASDAPDGSHVVRVSAAGSVSDYSIDDDPDTVTDSRAGTVYAASAWVKATDATDGKRICITLRERPPDGGSGPFSAASITASKDEYRQLEVTHRAEASGMRIGVHVFRLGQAAGQDEAFLADAITLEEGGGGAPSPDC